jgi:hypothetical protein
MNILTEFPQLYMCSMHQSIKKNPVGICAGSHWLDNNRKYRLPSIPARLDPLLYRMLGVRVEPNTYYHHNVGKKFNIDPEEFNIIQQQASGRDMMGHLGRHQDLINFGEYVRRCALLSYLVIAAPQTIRTQRASIEETYNSCRLAQQFPHAHSKLMEILPNVPRGN